MEGRLMFLKLDNKIKKRNEIVQVQIFNYAFIYMLKQWSRKVNMYGFLKIWKCTNEAHEKKTYVLQKN